MKHLELFTALSILFFAMALIMVSPYIAVEIINWIKKKKKL